MNKLEFELNSFAVFFQITFICKLQTAFVASMFIVNKSLYTLFTFVLFAYSLDAPQSQPAPDSEFPCEIVDYLSDYRATDNRAYGGSMI